jgi:hypothetical protein
VSGLAKLPPVRPLVDGLLYRGTLAQLSGTPGSYKTFAALAMACCLATGRDFGPHAVTGPARVLYIIGEGVTGLRVRIYAWAEHVAATSGEDVQVLLDLLDENLMILPMPVQLGNGHDVTEARKLVTELDPALIVFDTRARCTVGLEENSATEQGIAIDVVERLMRYSPSGTATGLVIHHSGRQGTAGRGSTAWDGQVWSDLRMSGDALHAVIECAKHKDVRDGCKHPLRLTPKIVSDDLMPDCTETERSTLVIVFEESGVRSRPAPIDQVVRTLVRSCAGPEGLTPAQIRDLVVEQKRSKSQAYAAINQLVKAGELANVGTEKRPRYVLKKVPGQWFGLD